MAKVRYHLGGQGPDICRADPSNPRSTGCPFGGASGSENHYDTMAEAEAAYEKQMEAEGNGTIITAATAATTQPRVTQLQTKFKEAYKRELDQLIADSSYGITVDPQNGYTADSSEGLNRLKNDFTSRLDDEVEPEVLYDDDSDNEVIRSIYIAELDLEISNQNADEDMRELMEYRSDLYSASGAYWRDTM